MYVDIFLNLGFTVVVVAQESDFGFGLLPAA